MDVPGRIDTIEELTALYRAPGVRAVGKQIDRIDPGMEAFIDLSPFLVLATSDGAGSIDASPRGGPPGFVRRLDERHIAIPDLNGNNRLDSYRNIVTHGRAGVLMIVPGKNETLRINGPAAITTDLDLLAGFTKELRRPKAAIVIETAEIYGHCESIPAGARVGPVVVGFAAGCPGPRGDVRLHVGRGRSGDPRRARRRLRAGPRRRLTAADG